jgi:cell division protein ZapA
MAQVNVTISGKTYRMACDDGQEGHLAGLADRLNEAIGQLREQFGEIGDLRLAVMAAIMMADQHADALRRLNAAEAEIETLQSAGREGGRRLSAQERRVAEQIAALADRVEALAARASGVPEDADSR